MGVLSLLITLGTAIGSWFVASEADKNNKDLADKTIAFGEKELKQKHGEFLQSIGLQEEGLALQQSVLSFQKDEAEKDRIEREKDRAFTKRKAGSDTLLGLFGAQSGLKDRVLDMWNNTGFFGGGQAGTPPAATPAPAPAGQGVFSAN